MKRSGIGRAPWLAVAPVVAALAGCAVGPDFVSPQAPTPAAWDVEHRGTPASRPVERALDPAWWTLFGDPQLTALVQRATANNLDVRLAASRLIESRWQRRIVGAAGLPSVGANANYQRMGASDKGMMSLLGVSSAPPASAVANGTGLGNSGLPGADASAPVNLYQYGFDASWELDFWGRTRRAVESADAMTVAANENRHGVILSVLTETAADYVQLRTVQATLASVKETLALATQSLDLTRKRRQEGVATALEVSEAAAQVQSIAARVPDLETQEDKLINALSLLVAEQPGALASELRAVRPVPPVPAEVPIGVPSELAKRRPDIREAEARLHAATAAIGVAKAEFYPSVTLSGSFGMQSLNFATLGTWAARQFAIGPTLNLPIFQGGRLTGMLRLREAQQQEAAIAYRKTVLGAWHEIDDALIEYGGQQRRREHLADALAHNRTAYDAAVARYKAGATTFLDVLVVQQALLDSQMRWVGANGDVSITAIRLFKALGGGWEHADAPAVRPQAAASDVAVAGN
ncbi:efflux transporter outer membrane subunit [Burkholderia cenocepacia]|uniref:efflux transporter outer membrane subunit n=1 Tax=Burkholderia cenocepacia TaxID=95486 RepID=UPI002AB7DD5C|nr:efflux transporter outer membrane subunit [Burkholderia cenocepacia]